MSEITREQVENFRQCLGTFCDDDEQIVMVELIAAWEREQAKKVKIAAVRAVGGSRMDDGRRIKEADHAQD